MEQLRSIKTFNFDEQNRSRLKTKSKFGIDKEKEPQKKDESSKMKSCNKLVNFSEMIPKLLDKIKSKNSSRVNLGLDNISYNQNSDSSDINDDENEINIINNKPCTTTKLIPRLQMKKKEEDNEYKNLGPITCRQTRNVEKSPSVSYRKYSKENKDSLVLQLHKYFFQDGEEGNIDTLIKYNINKIKISNISNKEGHSQNNLINNNSSNNLKEDIFDYLNIQEEVVNLMDLFAHAFDRENKKDLKTAINNLSIFAHKYKFEYVTKLTSEWLEKMQDKKYDKCEMKYIGYYNQIRDIMNKMLRELKLKADLMIITQRKKNKDNMVKNINNSNNNLTLNAMNVAIEQSILKKNSINKEDLLKTKEIVPIKIDIEVKNHLNINEVEDILKNLDEGDFGSAGNKVNANNQKKIINKHFNKNEELEAFSYPFKENNFCYIF